MPEVSGRLRHVGAWRAREAGRAVGDDAPPAALRIESLSKRFGHHQVLQGVDLVVADGAFTAVLGPSGCGKTTLLRVIAGFERADAGTVEIGGVIVDDGHRGHVPSARRRVGYVAQDGGLFPHLTVAANIGFGLRRRDRRARVAELLEFVDLRGLGRRRPAELSGGQQQRVALARALAPEPRLILLDEPFASLDASLRASLRGEVASVLRASGSTVLLVTHDQEEALSFGDQVAVMREGRFVQVGTPTDVYARPVDPEIATFVGEANLLPGRSLGTTVRGPLGRLTLAAPVPRDDNVLVLIRPEQCILTSAGPDAGNATVTRSDYHGHDATTQLLLDGHPDQPLVARVKGGDVVAPGTRITLSVAGAVHAWPATAGPASGAPPVGELEVGGDRSEPEPALATAKARRAG